MFGRNSLGFTSKQCSSVKLQRAGDCGGAQGQPLVSVCNAQTRGHGAGVQGPCSRSGGAPVSNSAGGFRDAGSPGFDTARGMGACSVVVSSS